MQRRKSKNRKYSNNLFGHSYYMSGFFHKRYPSLPDILVFRIFAKNIFFRRAYSENLHSYSPNLHDHKIIFDFKNGILRFILKSLKSAKGFLLLPISKNFCCFILVYSPLKKSTPSETCCFYPALSLVTYQLLLYEKAPILHRYIVIPGHGIIGTATGQHR